MGENCITCDVVLVGFALRFYRPGTHSFFTFISALIRHPGAGASGGSIFLLVKKDRGERHAKGLRSRPLESCFYTGDRRGDVRTPYEFAVMQFTRFRLVRWRAGGVRFARLRRKAKHHLFAAISLLQALLPPDSCVLLQLRCNRWHSKKPAFCESESWVVAVVSHSFWAAHPKGTSSGDADAPPSGRSTQRRGNKRQRRSRLNRVKRTVAKT